MEEMLSLQNLSIAYGQTQAVSDFSLSMAPGEIVSLVGESGSGKTSVIRAVLGLLPSSGSVTAGEMRFEGKDLRNLTQEQWRARLGASKA